jgi:hypothetical protein
MADEVARTSAVAVACSAPYKHQVKVNNVKITRPSNVPYIVSEGRTAVPAKFVNTKKSIVSYINMQILK